MLIDICGMDMVRFTSALFTVVFHHDSEVISYIAVLCANVYEVSITA